MSNKKYNKSTKKRIFRVLSAVLLLVISVVAVESIIFIIKKNSNSANITISWDYCAEYEQYSDDFNLVKDYIATEFPNTYEKSLSVSYDDENGYRLFDRDIDGYLILSDDTALSLNTICINAFSKKHAHFSAIIIHGETISFSINDGRCALIYSPEREPSWVDSPQEYTRVEFLEIRDGWYHVIDKDWKEIYT